MRSHYILSFCTSLPVQCAPSLFSHKPGQIHMGCELWKGFASKTVCLHVAVLNSWWNTLHHRANISVQMWLCSDLLCSMSAWFNICAAYGWSDSSLIIFHLFSTFFWRWECYQGHIPSLKEQHPPVASLCSSSLAPNLPILSLCLSLHFPLPASSNIQLWGIWIMLPRWRSIYVLLTLAALSLPLPQI